MTDTHNPAPPRWLPFVNLALAVIGTIGIVGGALTTFGGWRSNVDGKLNEHEKRLIVVETSDRANLPVFYRLQTNVEYLVERARKQDDQGRGR